MSGVITKIIPEEIAVKNMTTAAGRTDGSKTSFHFNLRIDDLYFMGSIKDSFTSKNTMIERMEQIAAEENKILKPYFEQIQAPRDCPAPIPNEIKVPQIPIALPRLSLGTISVNNAVAPVGVNPALNPWKNRSNKKKNTVSDKG